MLSKDTSITFSKVDSENLLKINGTIIPGVKECSFKTSETGETEVLIKLKLTGALMHLEMLTTK